MLELKKISASADGQQILNGFSLTIQKGEIHALMGPNGAGKSTIAKVIAGHPDYDITSGEILFEGENIIDLDPEERAQKGIFMGFQYPLEIPGVTNELFLRTAVNSHRKAQGLAPLSDEAFEALLLEKMALLGIKKEFKDRSLNEGFSGGEKKKNEILQMALLDPKIAILDETDSGLDIDAMRVVAEAVNTLQHEGRGLLLITHYQRLLDYIRPDFVHVVKEGVVVSSGDASLALELEERGYDWVGGACC